ncbi:hypothetical protein [Bacillus thuringiensis]|nr:hypothetical protein [Bacillus thuringiensis]
MLAYVDNVLSIQIDLFFIITYKIENSKFLQRKTPAKIAGAYDKLYKFK